MEDRIPPPTLDVPTNVKGIPASESFSVTWDSMQNVTGYEVSITSEGVTEYIKTDSHMIEVQKFGGKDIKNGTEFKVKVQSLNGEWRSGYSDEITVIPEPNSVPEPPDNLSLTGGHKEIKATWKDMDSTDTYNVYCREYEKGNFEKVASNIETNSYTISNLKEETRYQVYVTGVNKLGEGRPSITSDATTKSVKPVQMPKRGLINTSNGEGVLTEHIESVTLRKPGSGDKPWYMVDSTLDETEDTGFGVVDGSFGSYYRRDDWDAGASYPGNVTPTITFDEFYKMSYIAIAEVEADSAPAIGKVHVTYWDREGKEQKVYASELIKRQDAEGKWYTFVKLPSAIETNKIRIGVGRVYSSVNRITIAEICFYNYDDLEDKINGLYKDEMHVTLRDDVTIEEIEGLETRLNTIDETTQEYHPEKENLLKEIEVAKEILNNKGKFFDQIAIDTTVTSAKDGHITFKGGLNAWQPLGIVGYSGEEITIYVGSNNTKKVGESSNLQLVATQYHAESGKWHNVVQTLKIGKNTVTIPPIGTLDVEKGGSLYINYTGNNPNEVYGVRVLGGQKIPVLDLTKCEGEEAKKAAIKTYIEELEKVVPAIEEKHNTLHKDSEKTAINYNFDEKNCILGATEIVLDQMMYSVSSKQIYDQLKGSEDEKVNQLYNSLKAMDEMIDLFYAHKGLSKSAEAGAKNQYPSSRLNIRYQRMFAGAFMYAGGLHIGIEWDSIGGLANGKPIQTDANGKYQSGGYFGWGIAHEIGHIIDEGAYEVNEVTNNFYSVLAQAKDDNESVRFEYENVYDKVTSGTIGKASNVFTQLAMYWQLHLAYDKGGYNFKKYDTYKEQFDNLIFARMDTYARDVSVAPKGPDNNGIALTLAGANKDNQLMRLACAASKKNILEFFERWGLVPDEGTIEYASQFDKEERDIYYVNDEARAYELSDGAKMQKGTKVEATIEKLQGSGNQVKITLGYTNKDKNKNAMLGYEIVRSYMDNDKEVITPVAFVTADNTEYTDTVETINNRVFTYKVRAYDKYLNETDQIELTPVKISHEGNISKADWVIDTNLTSDTDVTTDGNDDMPCEKETEKGIAKVVANNDYSDEYIGKVEDNKIGEITISLGKVTSLVGFKYTAGNTEKAIKDYEIQISKDGSTWETVKTGTFTLDDQKSAKVYFNKEDDDWLYVYDTAYVKLIIKNEKEVSISELDLLGQSGDNVELVEEGIGYLEEDFVYEESSGKKIPQGSLIFTGTYKGNPAYNVVKLWDQDNELIGGYQIIMAPNPGNGALGDVSEGRWIYWIEPQDENFPDGDVAMPTTVRAELYRVDDAHSNEGERLVSDTFRVSLKADLPKIKLSK